MLANPRTVGASNGDVEVEAHSLAVLLDNEGKRRLALGHHFEEFGVLGKALRQFREAARVVEQGVHAHVFRHGREHLNGAIQAIGGGHQHLRTIHYHRSVN